MFSIISFILLFIFYYLLNKKVFHLMHEWTFIIEFIIFSIEKNLYFHLILFVK